ncbi:MAG: pyruvate dehydrogenase (acetyl-transferring) E1 component subunit alpha [Chloroflexi bacterium]|nr:pyruvate dehydrogenase (acetyl-transferring) E1 component subunit alpha [Chloroflexota bacterium]
MAAALPEKATLLEWYRQMVLIRRFEERSKELFHQKKIGGVYLHLYNGQEGTGVGALAALRPQDHVITAYRDHGIAIARGVDPNRIMAEMYGKSTGVSGGKGGSMHLASREHNFWGGYAIVGGHLPLAAGIALKAKYNGDDEVVLCFIGDGATNNGYFHEALNLSAVWDLPVVWLIENNLYGMGTALEDASGQTKLIKRAIAYDMKAFDPMDGQDVFEVHETVKKAVDYARKKGPVLLESMTYRFEGHGMSDKMYAARVDEMSRFKARDPITLLHDKLCELYPDIGPTLDTIDKQCEAVVTESEKYAENSPAPTFEDLTRHIYV